MGHRPTPEATAVAEALRHLAIDVDIDGSHISVRGGEPITVHLDEPGPEATQIVVRDQVTPSARRALSESGVGWLDLRGRLSVRTPALVIEADVPGVPDLASQRRTRVFAGAVVSGVTIAALVRWPKPLSGVRATARLIDATPGGVSLALKRLTAAGYMTSDHRATRELFWAAVEEWRPEWVELPASAVPPSSEAVAVGGLAAAKLGAPVAVTADTTAEFLLPSASSLKYAEIVARTSPIPEVTVRVSTAPAPIVNVLMHPDRLSVNTIPITAEAVVALSMAIDPARGAETVRSWEGEAHVWS